MKKRNVLLTTCFAVLLTMTLIVMNSGVFHAITKEELSPKEELQLQGFGWEYYNKGEAAAYEYIASYGGAFSANVVQLIVDNGYNAANHIDELKALGYTNVDYSAVTGSSNAATHTQTQPAESVKTPEPFTVETYNPAKTMWTTQIVNCREGASTEYNKVGSLKEHEQVNVTGVASTGWYQITKEDGTVMYVSNKYLTEEDPTKEEIVKVVEESQIKEEEATPEPPEPTLEPMPEQTATPDPTIEPTMEPTQEPTAEPVVEPTVDDTTIERNSSTPYIVAGIIGILVIAGIVVVVRKKKK